MHDHETRDRLHYSANEGASNEANQEGDNLWLVFETGLIGDAGTIVPEAVWPATGRVTALVASTVEHSGSVGAEMARVDCLAGPCCGLTECRCEPGLQIRFGGGNGVIEVDGNSYRITPAFGAAGAGVPWNLG